MNSLLKYFLASEDTSPQQNYQVKNPFWNEKNQKSTVTIYRITVDSSLKTLFDEISLSDFQLKKLPYEYFYFVRRHIFVELDFHRVRIDEDEIPRRIWCRSRHAIIQSSFSWKPVSEKKKIDCTLFSLHYFLTIFIYFFLLIK